TRAEGERLSFSEQRRDVARAEPACRLAVCPGAFPPEEDAAHPDSGEEKSPRLLRLLGPSVLPEEEQVAAQVLAVETASVRGGADVYTLGVGKEENPPARLAKAKAPVGFLAEEEELLVEVSDVLDGLATDEEARAHHELGRPHLVVGETVAVEAVQQPRARRELAQEEVLGSKSPERRKAAHRPLQRPVRVQQARRDDSRTRFAVRERDESRECVAREPRVGVQEQYVAALGRA